ncbi:MAG: hypothetical protein GX301_01330 [Gracilibacteraceae bacterium]|jgi:hypothetical protein|nr:hypothetical protein [Gracilibacteraceae bacterium]
MQCQEINSLVMRYFDGNISELELEMIVKHNEKCRRCAEDFEVLKEAIDTLEELPEIEVPAGFAAKVMEGIISGKTYSTNPKVVAFWLVSILGLMVFGWNMAAYVIIPLIRESGIIIAVNNVLIYGFNVISGILSQIIVAASILLGKILVMRNVLLRDYITSVTLIVLTFMAINVFLAYRRKLQEN